MKRIKRQLLAVQFLDHCSGSDVKLKPVTCEVAGFLVFENDLYLRLASWVAEGQADNHNNEFYVVLKSTILSRKVMK